MGERGRTRRLAAVVGLAITLALVGTACGDDPASTAGAPPATALPSQCSDLTVATMAAPTVAGEPAAPHPAPPADDDGTRVTAYGCAHLDEWAGVRFDGTALVAAFTGHLDEHEAALRMLVSRPDAVRVEAARHTAAEAAAVLTEVAAILESASAQGEVRSWGPDGGVVAVGLRADARALADDLLARFGDRVEITLGRLRYPSGEPGPDTCGAVPVGQAVPGLTAALVLDGPVASGADFTGHVVLRNDGPTTIAFDLGDSALATVRDDAGRVIAAYDGAIAGVGITVSLDPGADTTLAVFGGTANCDPALGRALPPGRYPVIAAIDVGTVHSGPVNSAAGPILAGPADLEVTG